MSATRSALAVLALLTLLLAKPAAALVNPVTADNLQADWYVDIHARLSTTGAYIPVCKGSLISRRWVLTSPACFLDPERLFEQQNGISEDNLYVQFTGLAEPVAVQAIKRSGDLNIYLLQLATAVTISPVQLDLRPAAALVGATLFVPGFEATPSLGHSYFNPTGSADVSCTVNGQLFSDGESFCFVSAQPQYLPSLHKVNATVITAQQILDRGEKLDTYANASADGSQLYLDLRSGNGYPCNEDVGAPIMLQNPDGSVSQVGVVSRVGLALGLPMCNTGLLNVFAATAYYADFISTTLAEGQFTDLCPAQPELHYVSVAANTKVQLFWDPVPGATGYRLLSTPDEGFVGITVTDVGSHPVFTIPIPAGKNWSVAVLAYNEQCNSPLSRAIQVKAGGGA